MPGGVMVEDVVSEVGLDLALVGVEAMGVASAGGGFILRRKVGMDPRTDPLTEAHTP